MILGVSENSQRKAAQCFSGTITSSSVSFITNVNKWYARKVTGCLQWKKNTLYRTHGLEFWDSCFSLPLKYFLTLLVLGNRVEQSKSCLETCGKFSPLQSQVTSTLSAVRQSQFASCKLIPHLLCPFVFFCFVWLWHLLSSLVLEQLKSLPNIHFIVLSVMLFHFLKNKEKKKPAI